MRLAVCVFALGSVSCSVGVGDGTASGLVTAPNCGMDAQEFDLRPNFYSAAEFEGTLSIRIQRGSDFAYLSNGITIFVADTVLEKSRLGTPIQLSEEAGAPVRVNLYLNKRCEVFRDDPPVNYVAVEGEIVFDAMYAPDLDEDDLSITGRFENVRFTDTSRPDERFADFSADFDFLFNRGRPAQPYL